MRSEGSSTNVIAAILLAVLSYPLSLPLAALVVGYSGGLSSPLARTLEFLYMPCLWLAANFPPYTFYLSVTFDALGMNHP